jgi:hypothetical protein
VITIIVWITTGEVRGMGLACLVLYGILAASCRQSFLEEEEMKWDDKVKENGLAMDMIAYICNLPFAGARDYKS